MNTTVAPATPSIAGPERTCAQCSTVFHPYRPTARFCSSLCRVRAHRGVTAVAAGEVRLSPRNASEDAFRPAQQPSDDEGPRYIQSTHGEHRIYPRTYAEHGLPLPDYLRVQQPRP